ncbi:MAG: HDIG domain-containing protein [Clostridiales bacterium]|nr:HDIG domain-containing protein [Clostridiales bacterium]
MRNSKKNQKLFKVIRIIAIILLAVLMVAIVYFGSLPKQYDVYQGQTSEYDITATRTIKDSYETERRARIARSEVAPIYVISSEVSEENKKLVKDFFNYCEELRKANIDDVGVVIRNKAEMSSLLQKAVKETYQIDLSDEVAYTLANISFVDYSYVQFEANEITEMITMNALDSQTLTQEINNYASYMEESRTHDSEEYISQRDLVRILLETLLKPNAVYDEKATENAREAAYKNAVSEPVMIQKGTRIISVGETITPHVYSQLQDLDLLPTNSFNYMLLFGIIVYMFIIVAAGAFYLMRYDDTLDDVDSKTLIALMLAFVIPLITSRYLTSISPLFSTIMFTAVIFATYLGIQGGITMSFLSLLVVLPMSGFNTELIFVSVITFFVCCVVAGRRNHKFNAATLIIFSCIASVMASLGYNLVTQSSTTDTVNSALWSVISTGCSVVAAIGFQPLFELISNSASPMRLLDLAQQSHPLQKRLFLEAPGTSQHSMMVANLADAAAEAIGANALLAKVGSYYHDIGKLERPEYFTENQQDKVNPHDSMNIEDSVAIITSHPSDGLKLAKKYRLPLAIQNIILEHHGTTCPG